ncbi:MAG: hypothetical protein E7298_09070 [Lachnospiraceae bacterium]|nr:hypothetical protein [Lachnospiraceae bacterium]
MSYVEKLLYISAIERVLEEDDSVKRNLYLDELIDISGRNGKTRETDVLEKLKSNKGGMRDYAIKNGNGYIFREMLATAYEKGLHKTTKENMRIRVFGDYLIADDVIIIYNGKSPTVTVPAHFEDINVRKVGAGVFYGNEAVEEICVADGISEIGNGAFGKCPHLKSISLAQSVETIHPMAFEESDAIWSIKMYKDISDEAYDDIVENGIKLTDGRYIIDPMILGGPFARQVREFLPVSMSGRFRVHKNMGCLFEVPPRAVDIKKTPVPLVFQQYMDDHNASSNDFRNENAAFVLKIKVRDIDHAFEHDEEADDFSLSNTDKFDRAGLVFVKRFIGLEGGNMKALLEIKSGTYFFQRGLRVRQGRVDYYLCFREEFSSDDNRPYVRRFAPSRVFSRFGPISEGDKRFGKIYGRLIFYYFRNEEIENSIGMKNNYDKRFELEKNKYL